MISKGEGELVVARHPASAVKAEEYVPCCLCMGFFARDTLYVHLKRCPLKREGSGHKRGRAYKEGLMMVESYLPTMTSTQQKVVQLLEGMRDTNAHRGSLLIAAQSIG